jgi:hypothetical protein
MKFERPNDALGIGLKTYSDGITGTDLRVLATNPPRTLTRAVK